MLTHLSISNLATIEHLSVEFGDGFSILTGETGAGKSILIDAIRFVLGGRTGSEQLRRGSVQGSVEVVFLLKNLGAVRAFLADLGVPENGELILRRVMGENGRSRALANDCSLTQGRLEELGATLINIHGQHDNQMLLNPETHIRFLDGFGGLSTQTEDVAAAHRAYALALKEKKTLEEQAAQRAQKTQELNEEMAEIQAAQLKPGEEESLSEEHERLTHVEKLGALIGGATEELGEGDSALLSRLASLGQTLEAAAEIDNSLKALMEDFSPFRFGLEDIHRSLASYLNQLEADPNRLDQVNERLALIERLKRKFGDSVPDILERLEQNQQEALALEKAENAYEEIHQKALGLARQLHSLSDKLSRARKSAGEKLEGLIEEQLADLGMEKAVFKTEITPLGGTTGKTYTPQGMDKVAFLLSANPGQDPKPLARIASGGELSRIMLALKTILAEMDPTPTLIFDEVDTGISGATAEIVGHKLKTLGAARQVLCVTHLPQIAALGHEHLLVTKQSTESETYTTLVPLKGKDRVAEVARLMSGLNVSDHSLASAEDMIAKGTFQ